MIKKIPIGGFMVVAFMFSNVAFSQTPFNGPIIITNYSSNGINAGITTQLRSGMTFATNQDISTSSSFMKDFDQYSYRRILNNGNLNAFSTNYNIKGTRFLFDEWVRGTIVKNSGEEISGNIYYFNFDKITNNLLVTIDKQSIIEVYKDSIQSFSFKEKGEVFAFEKFPSIERYRFVRILIKNTGKFSLYKSIHTRLVAADFETNGLTESGNPYDEYVDSHKYYIVCKGEVRPVELKFSSIKKALKENSSLAKDYYANHIFDEIDEAYLSGIVDYVNNH
ncbi:MAG TPA: hypothetical protein VGG71_07140 [Chitinophagaceae bacterium]